MINPDFGALNEVILPKLKSFKYLDNLDEADTVEIVLADNEHNFIKSAAIPARGSEIPVKLINGLESLNCGTFEIDEISYRTPPSELTLKLNSISGSAELRGTGKNRSWELTTLEKICADIANGSELQLFYDVETIEIKRAEQAGESDLSFLKKLCKKNGVNLKIHDGRLIIFDAAKYENLAAVDEISYDDARLLSFDTRATLNDIYSSANTNFAVNGLTEWLGSFFGLSADLIGTVFEGGSGGGRLVINERVESQAESEKLAASKLREKNKKEFTCNLKIIGDFNFLAGNNLELKDFGIFSGKFQIKKATHSLNQGGYVTNLQLEKCLNY